MERNVISNGDKQIWPHHCSRDLKVAILHLKYGKIIDSSGENEIIFSSIIGFCHRRLCRQRIHGKYLIQRLRDGRTKNVETVRIGRGGYFNPRITAISTAL